MQNDVHIDAPIRSCHGSCRAFATGALTLASSWLGASTQEKTDHLDPLRRLRERAPVSPHPRQSAWKPVSILLTVALTVAVAAPAFASQPGHGHRGDRHERPQRHERSARGKHHGKRRSVTRSFSNDSAIAIPTDDSIGEFGPADPYPSPIEVTGFRKGTITDVNLTLRDLSHTFTPDVDVLLVAPDGRNAVVMSAVGSTDPDASPVTNLTIRLDDEAATPLSDGAALTSGSFQPFDGRGSGIDGGDLTEFPSPAPTPSGANALSTFDGSDPNGQWRLFIIDDTDADVGTLADGWSLQITATVTSKAKKHKH